MLVLRLHKNVSASCTADPSTIQQALTLATARVSALEQLGPGYQGHTKINEQLGIRSLMLTKHRTRPIRSHKNRMHASRINLSLTNRYRTPITRPVSDLGDLCCIGPSPESPGRKLVCSVYTPTYNMYPFDCSSRSHATCE